MSQGPSTPIEQSPPTAPQGHPTLTFRGGGWIIAVTLAACVAIVLWAFASVIFGSRPVGDGADPRSYGFDLAPSDLEGGMLVASGNPRDFLVALDEPRVAAGRDILEINRQERGKYLVTTDRVIGVEIGGVARAYPLRLLNAHEVCNDVLADVPIAVTYSPLCDSAVVFDRRVPGAGAAGPRVLRFGVSGLLLDSNLLMYDRDEGAGGDAPGRPRSLWSQLLGRAVAGPDAVGDDGRPLRLESIPAVQVVPWAMWLERRPDTTVALRDPDSARRIKEIDYGRYWAAGDLLYPVSRAPDAQSLASRGLGLMSPAVAVTIGGATRVFALPEIAGAVPAEVEQPPPWTTEFAGRTITFTLSRDRRSAWVDAGDALLVHGRWFALSRFDGGAP